MTPYEKDLLVSKFQEFLGTLPSRNNDPGSTRVLLCVRKVAQQKGVTKEQLAAKAHIPIQTLERCYWYGYGGQINIARLEDIARALGVSFFDLFEVVEGLKSLR